MHPMENKIETSSLCPVCMKKIDALLQSDNQNSRMKQYGSEETQNVLEGIHYTDMNRQIPDEKQKVYMIKKCPEHGEFRTLVWKGSTRIESWVRGKIPAEIKHPITSVVKGCPYDCGICKDHRQHTCTALIEVTQNCNLSCTYCFADAHAFKKEEPLLELIRAQYNTILKVSGHCNIQLSGGEPTMRDDLFRIVEIGKNLGFTFIQVNTNGIRIANDFAYTKKLKEAGLTSVFLQFDGTKDDIYKLLRGKELFDIKKKAIEHCKELRIGVVLVPTLVPGVNVDNIGEILEFGMAHTPTVRGVHFQPVSYFGRVPFAPSDENRITLPEVMDEICIQTKGMIPIETLKPPGCENSLCSFHGNYMMEGNNRIKSSTLQRKSCCNTDSAEEGSVKSKTFVNRKWSLRGEVSADRSLKDSQHSDWDKILEQISDKSFSISAMAFQDVWNVDLERIKDCCIHVSTPEGRLIPFCLYNITNSQGEYLYRDKEM